MFFSDPYSAATHFWRVTRTKFKRLEKGVFHRLGDKEKNVSAHSRGTKRKSYYSSRKDTKTCYQSSRSKETEIASEKHHHKRKYSQRTEAVSESKGSAEGHWKSKPKKQKLSVEDDLSQPCIPGKLPPTKKCIKDPVEIHNLKQRDGESTEEFMRRYTLECRDVKGAPECMKISRFMHGITNPELIKRLHDKIPKSMDEMMSEAGKKQNFKRENFRNEQRTKRKQDRFTLLTKTPKEILALDKGKFRPPPPMTAPVEKKNASKFCRKIITFDQEIKAKPWKRPGKDSKKGGNLRERQTVGNINGEEDGTEGPMIIETEIGGHYVYRISPSPYNGIIRRPMVRKIRAIPSTMHGMLKLPVASGIVTLRSSRIIPLECSMVLEPGVSRPIINQVTEEKILVAIHPKYPEQTIAVGSMVTDTIKKRQNPSKTEHKTESMEKSTVKASLGLRLGEAFVLLRIYLHQLDTFYNALNSKDQDSLNSAAGVVAKVSTNTSTSGISPDVAELKDMVKALLLDKKGVNQAPATVKAVEESCVTCGGAHSYFNSPTIKPVNPPVSAPRPNLRPSIPYPSRMQDQKLRDKANNQREKCFQIFKDLNFNISFADALILMLKFSPSIKSLLTNKDKLCELARTSLNKHCLAVLLKKFPKKLGDPGKFLFPCDFTRKAKCLALADLGASINLMPLSVWTKFSLLDLTPTFMNLKLVDRSISRPVGVAEDVYVKVEVDAFLAIDDDPTSPQVDQSYLDPEGDILLLEAFINDDPSLPPPTQGNYLPKVRKELKIYEAKSDKSSIDEPPEVELEDLPPHLEYAFLEGDDKFPVIIAKYLSVEEKTALITVIKSHKRAIAWKLSDIKGIDPEFFTHKILIEEDFEPVVQHQRSVNPKIHDVIKQEVIKLLDAGLIYLISDSPWVSLVHCVPNKGGFTIVENEDNELISTRLVTGWCICIDYRKLNEATHKDYFHLSFMDHMLEILAGNHYYCFLDDFSGYFQIPIDIKDQEKTTFTCPYGMFAYRRM
nr:reverse transcriptase domain-containing protein [Tanacetum cinerariifolium]